MIKYIVPLVLILAACGEAEPTPYCNCVNASRELFETQLETVNADGGVEDTEEFKTLREAKTTACKDFENISAEEVKKLKAECENN